MGVRLGCVTRVAFIRFFGCAKASEGRWVKGRVSERERERERERGGWGKKRERRERESF
jgi:hypothetical protein